MRWFSHVRVLYCQSIFPVRCSSHVVFMQIQSPANGGARVFLPAVGDFPVVRRRERGRAYEGGTLYKGPLPLVFWHVVQCMQVVSTSFPLSVSLSLSACAEATTLSHSLLIVLLSISLLLIRSLSSTATLTGPTSINPIPNMALITYVVSPL